MTSEQATEEVRDIKKDLHALNLLPSVAQFVSLYRFAFKLPEIEIEELEDGLLEANEVGGKVLQDLLVGLVKGIQPSRGVNASNLEEHLHRLLRKFWQLEKADGNPFAEDTTFSQLDIALKVEFLHFLCCMRVDRPDAQDAMKEMDADALRVQPLGNDDEGNEYWYFFGTRLYKQEPSKEKTKNWEEEWNHQKDQSFNKRGRGRGRPRKVKLRKSDGESDDFEDVSKNGRYMNIDEKSRWSVVCNTIEDWVDFAEKLKGSKSKNEKALFQTVTDNFLPVLNEIYQEKERRLQQKLRELVPRRIVTRRETRKQRVKSLQEHNGYDAETAHREHLARDRAQRLEERNRRLSQSAERSKSRSRRDKYTEEEEDDYEDEDDFQEVDVETTPQSDESNDYRQEYMPVITGESTDLKSQVLKVLSEVKLQKDAWPFLYPVDESYAPGYYEIITDPMDLSSMSSKLLDNAYKTIGHIDEDFRKMVDNCKLYNGESSGMSNMVMNLWRVFRRGMAKIGSPPSQTQNASSRAEPTISRTTEFPKEAEGNSNDYQMKRPSESQDGRKKKKKKIKNMEALEMLSQEAKIAVEKSSSNDMDGPQPKPISLYSDLKIVPIHSHPTSLIEKFSDSSNQEVDDLDSSNASASSYLEQGSDSPSMGHPEDSEKDSPVKANMPYFPQNEDSSDLSELIEKNNGKGFNILSDGEGNHPSVLSDNEVDLQSAPRTAPYNIPLSGGRNPKTTSSNDSGMPQNEVSVIDSCNNNNMSSLMSGLPRESMYSIDGQRVSPVGTSVNPHTSVTQNYLRKSPPNSFAVGRNPTLLPEGQQMPRPNLSNEMTTVDASALGISHFGQYTSANLPPVSGLGHTTNQTVETFPSSNPFAKVPQSSPKNKPRYSPTFPSQLQLTSHQSSQDFQSVLQYQKANNGDHSMANASNNIATFTTHMAQQPGTSNSQVATQHSKIFQNPGQMLLQPTSDSNKFPTMKVTLPPSTGELLVVPGDPANSGMTFHLFAQPHSNPSQPIQSRMQVFADGSVQHQSNLGSLQHQSNLGSVQHQSNQATVNSGENHVTTITKAPTRTDSKGREERSPNRKSPTQDLLSIPATTKPTTTLPYQLPSTTTKPITNIPGLPRYSEPYTSANMMPTYSNITPSLVRPNALRHHNPAFTTASEVPTTDYTRPSNPFLQNSVFPQTMCSTTMPPAFPTYSYRQAIVNGGNAATMTTSSAAAKPPRINLQKVYLPNPQQLNQNAIMQNGNGQFILWPPTKDAAKRSPNGDPSQKGQEVERRVMPEPVTSASFYPGANNMFTFQSAPGNPSQVYAQVLPSQLPQYVNQQGTPYYIVTDPNSLQNPQRYPLMNMQPIPFPNR